MNLIKLYESDWAIGGQSNPEENEFMKAFVGMTDPLVDAAEEVYALSKIVGHAVFYTRKEVPLRFGAALLITVNRQFYADSLDLNYEAADLQETIYEYRHRGGELICYRHVVYGDCGTVYFKIDLIDGEPA